VQLIGFDGTTRRKLKGWQRMRTTVTEIARVAGVSPATVDRVLNDRDGVRQRTRDLVRATAEKLGYFGPVEAEAPKKIRMDFVLPAGTNSFMRGLKGHLIDAAGRRGDTDARIHEVAGWSPSSLSDRLRALKEETEAIGLVALDHPQVREEVDMLARSGIKVATLVSDLPSVQKVGYVGVDNRAAGRLAGFLMGRFLQGKGACEVAVCIGSHAYRGHEEREMGFRAVLSEDFPDLRIASFVEIGDDRDRAYEAVRESMARQDIHGIYNIGSGNQGIARVLRENGCSREVVFIGHDLTDATRLMLLDRTMDAAIDQNPRVEAREIVRLLASAVKGTREPEYPARLQVVFRENLPVT
jgi:LacI family transcriptional regulator